MLLFDFLHANPLTVGFRYHAHCLVALTFFYQLVLGCFFDLACGITAGCVQKRTETYGKVWKRLETYQKG